MDTLNTDAPAIFLYSLAKCRGGEPEVIGGEDRSVFVGQRVEEVEGTSQRKAVRMRDPARVILKPA